MPSLTPPSLPPCPLPLLQLARAFEAFGRFLALRPDLTAPLVSACLSTALMLPLDEPGHSPPPVPITALWKIKFEARLSLCAAVVSLAKVGEQVIEKWIQRCIRCIRCAWW